MSTIANGRSGGNGRDLSDVNPGPALRYVLWNDAQGIYLGGENWSRTNPGSEDRAPTYPEDTVAEAVAEVGTTVPGGCDKRLVWPDLPGHMASKNAVANAGLPRW